MKILRRIYVALAMIVLAGGMAMILLFHTGPGRELVREQLEQRLGQMFVGKVSVGSVEGDPFGEMSLHDLALDDAEGRPAVRIKLLRVRLSVFALARREVHVDRLIIDGGELYVSRAPDGKLELPQLVHQKQRSHWDFELPDIRIANSRVVDGDEVIGSIELRGRLAFPFDQPMVVSVAGAATVRGAPAFAMASLAHDETGWRIPHALVASRGAVVAVAGAEVHGKLITGSVLVDASQAAARRFGLALPDDVRAFATLDGERIDAVGRVGTTPMQLLAHVDLETKRISGLAIAAEYQLPRGRIGGVATFDLAMGPAGGLPIGTAFAQLHGDAAEAPDARVGVAFSSDGTTAHLAVDASARGGRALVGGDVAREAKQIALHGVRLIASNVQLEGTTLRANLVASGAVKDLAVAGSVDATALRRSGMSATSAHLALDAHHVPSQPTGSATLRIEGLARGNQVYGALVATVKTLADGRLAITADAGANHADATVAYAKGSTHVQLGRHRLNAPDGAIWQGNGGAIDVTPTAITASGLRTASRYGNVELAGSYQRATRRLVADASAKSQLVDALQVHVAMGVPRGHDWRGAIETATLRATGVHAEPPLLDQVGITINYGASVDLAVDYDHHTGKLVATARHIHGERLAQPLDLRIEATTDAHETRAQVALRGPAGVNLGDLDVVVAAPAEAIRRDAAITGALTLVGAPAPMYSAVLGRDQITGGLLAGKIAITGTLAEPAFDGELVGRGVMTPPTHGGSVLAVLDDLRVKGSWRAGELALRVDGKEHAGGTLALTAHGRLDDRDHFRVGVVAHAFDLAPVLALLPGAAAGGLGHVECDLAMTGLDVRDAKLSGVLHVTEGRFPLSPTIGTLRRADFTAVLEGQTAQLTLDGMLGEGTVKGTGSISLVAGVPTKGEIALAVRKVSPIGITHPDISADVTGKVHREGKKWLVDMVVDHGLVVIPQRRGVKLHEVGAPSEMVFVQGPQPKRVTKFKEVPIDPSFVLNVEIKPATIIDQDMRGVVTGKVLVSDSHAAIGMLGDITAARGNVDLFGRRYVVERAALHFDGSTDPLLDVRISHDFADVTTTATIRGRFSKPEVVMSSSPAVYTQGQLLGFLLGGEPSGDPRDVTARDRATNAGTSLLANEIGSYVRGALPLGIDILRYQSSSPESSAAVTAGSWVTRDLFLAYRRHLDARPDENANESDVEYWLTHHLSIEGTAGDREYDGIDLLWRTRY